MLEVGQKLWFVPKYRGAGHEIIITKVGRKWADFDGRRAKVNIESLEVFDGDYHAGQCHLSREEYEATVAANKLWSEFRNKMHNRPKDVTSEDIIAAAQLFKIDLEAK